MYLAPKGFNRTTDGWGVEKKEDTFTCKHCNGVVFVEPFQDPAEAGGWCMACTSLICKHCVQYAECKPFEKQLDQHERMERLRAQW